MNDAPVNQSHMIETTDCLEAVGVFRGWKNFFFLLVVICLLLSQVSFWLIDRGIVQSPAAEKASAVDAATVTDVETLTETAAADTIAAIGEDSEVSEDQDGGPLGASLLSAVDFERLGRVVQLVNGILVVTAVLYCMAMFFSLMVSLIGRLGGINHVSRAFFLSLIMLMLVTPWQSLLESSVVGVIFSSGELEKWLPGKSETLVNTILYYLRFSGYWLVVMLLLIMSQVRSARWTKAILRRLEII